MLLQEYVWRLHIEFIMMVSLVCALLNAHICTMPLLKSKLVGHVSRNISHLSKIADSNNLDITFILILQTMAFHILELRKVFFFVPVEALNRSLYLVSCNWMSLFLSVSVSVSVSVVVVVAVTLIKEHLYSVRLVIIIQDTRYKILYFRQIAHSTRIYIYNLYFVRNTISTP